MDRKSLSVLYNSIIGEYLEQYSDLTREGIKILEANQSVLLPTIEKAGRLEILLKTVNDSFKLVLQQDVPVEKQFPKTENLKKAARKILGEDNNYALLSLELKKELVNPVLTIGYY